MLPGALIQEAQNKKNSVNKEQEMFSIRNSRHIPADLIIDPLIFSKAMIVIDMDY